ncbi:hypothetical protein JXO59_15335 [candidate division KSB1 bacterium]|nr:hypothetical protein [candidate division KSB1 bacterium]
MEGRLNSGGGSFIFSARKRLLEVVDRIVGISAVSLTAIPRYWKQFREAENDCFYT